MKPITTPLPKILARQNSLVFTLISLLLQINPLTATLCYTPNGTVSDDRPCNASAAASVCCTQGFLCTSTLLCQPADWWDGSGGNPQQFIRGTCTDKTWASPECQGHCVADSVGGGEWVMRCGKNSSNYCCSADDCCDRKSFHQFSLDDPTITATAGVVQSTTSATSTIASIGAASTSTESESGPESGPSRSKHPTTFSFTSSPTQTPTTAVTSPSSSDTSTGSDNNSSSDTTTAIGVGVGVGAGIVLISSIVAVWLIRMRRRRRAAAQQQLHNTQSQHMEYVQSDMKYPSHLPPRELEARRPLPFAELDGRSVRGIAELQ